MASPPESPDLSSRQRELRDEQAAGYDDFLARRGWWNEVELEELQSRLIPLLHPATVVWDAGCGTGRITPFIAQRAGMVHGTDYSPASIAKLQEKAHGQSWESKLDAQVADLTRPSPWDAGSIDLVFCQQTLQHLDHASRQIALQEFHKALKPGGRLAMVVYAYPSWCFPTDMPAETTLVDSMYVRQWSGPDLKAELQAANFRTEILAPMVAWPQLRRLGGFGKVLEYAAHRGWLPSYRSAYWYVQAMPV